MYSCTTDFDTTASYEDITIVYGLLDQTQADQYLKINKAFLSETDVLTYAQVPDSSYYPYALNIKLEEWNRNDILVNTFTFDTTTIYNKEPGQFYNPEQILYKWNRPENPIGVEYIKWGQDIIDSIPIWLNANSTYKLIITNPETGKEISSETVMVDDFEIVTPTWFTKTLKFTPDQGNTKKFAWNNTDNAGKYEINMRFHYREVKGATEEYKYIDLMERSVNSDQGADEISVFYADDQFYSACNTLIPYDDQTEENKVSERHTDFIEIIISAAEENFSLYLEVNEPSTSIVQDKPQYSNIENGLGIFSSRSKFITLKKLNGETIATLKSDYPQLKFAD